MKKTIKLEPFQETLYSSMCGAASLKIVLDYYGVQKSEKELAKLCKVDKDLGTDDKSIKRVAEKIGIQGCYQK